MSKDDAQVVGFDSARWGFIGAGKMATAMIKGMLRTGVPPDRISASDISPTIRTALAAETGVTTLESNRAVVGQSDVVVLAVKPQVIGEVTAALRPAITPDHLVISIAAGISLANLADSLGAERRIARVMPNTPSLVGEGASGYCLGSSCREGDEAIVRGCFESVGLAVRVAEPLLDAVTGLSGSGPAFVYIMIEALSDGGVRAGLPREVAISLAAQTVLGAAKMVLETGLHPGVLKDQVTSPAGTTIAGLHALERAGVRAALMDAVMASAGRCAELAAASARSGGSG